jgi:fructose-bisphosphate aldolase, class I
MDREALMKTAVAMVAPGKGILAMDESQGTCDKRFKKLNIPTTVEHRRAYRDMLLSDPRLGDFISGAILFDETIRQKTLAGKPFAEHLKALGIIPGIKVDTGAKDLAGFPNEKVTEGLDGLRERLAEYHAMGARFSKWRAVITIGDSIPSVACLEANAHALARYAALCQEAGIVPIVEPEVLLDGDHTIERSYEVHERTLDHVFRQLKEQGVMMEGMVLKASMVVSGKDSPNRANVQRVAEETVRCLLNTVPPAVPGIAFLSGGQTDEEASAHLNAMNKLARELPWRLTFSYGRALQQAAMEAWRGDPGNVQRGQKEIFKRARLNGAAARGQYRSEMEKEAA